MDDNVAVPLICDFLVNCDEEIERFLRNENDFDFVAIAGVSCCFVRRNLTRIQNYFESTVSNYFGDEFAAHFRMTRTTAELLTREVINTGRIPLGNPFGRPSIPPQKQVLVFLWSCKWNGMFPFRSVATKKVEQLRRLSVCSGKFPLEPRVPFAFQPVEPEILAKWKAPLVLKQKLFLVFLLLCFNSLHLYASPFRLSSSDRASFACKASKIS